MSVTYSFDVFDTSICRTTGDAKTLFYCMAQSIFTDYEDCFVQEFVNNRINAEVMSRKVSKNNEVDLKGIYEYFDMTSFPQFSREFFMQSEIEAEIESSMPILEMLDYIENIRKDADRVIFISDMYLSETTIKRILIKNNVWREGDYIYVSSDQNATKSSGLLFQKIKRDFQLAPKDWIHIGDNKHSDYKVPKSIGINAIWKQFIYNKYEQLLINESYYSDRFYTIYHIASLLRAYRLSTQNEEGIAPFIIDLIAPLYIPYVISILKDAKQKGIKKIFFLSRDGKIFYKIATSVKVLYPEIELVYLYVSRRALYLPSIYPEDTCSLDDFHINVRQCTPRQIMHKLNIEDHFINRVFEGRHIDADFVDRPVINDKDEALFRNVFASDMVQGYIKKKASEDRKLVVSYFEQNGLNESTSAFVDLGWTRTCQQSLNRIIMREGWSPIQGYYFAVFYTRKQIAQAGVFTAAIYKENIINKFDLRAGFEGVGVSILEHIFSMTEEASVIGYKKCDNGRILPVTKKDNRDMVFVSKFVLQQEQLLTKITVELSKIDFFIENVTPFFYQYGLRIYTKFLTDYSKSEIEFFRSITVDNGIDDDKRLIERLNTYQIIKYLVGALFGRNNLSHVYSLDHSLVYNFKYGRSLIKIKRWLKHHLSKLNNGHY